MWLSTLGSPSFSGLIGTIRETLNGWISAWLKQILELTSGLPCHLAEGKSHKSATEYQLCAISSEYVPVILMRSPGWGERSFPFSSLSIGKTYWLALSSKG